MWVYFWVFYSVSLIYVFVLLPVQYGLDEYSFVISPDVWNCDVSPLPFFFKIALAIWGIFWLNTNVKIVLAL